MATVILTTTFTNFSTIERVGSPTSWDWANASNAGTDDSNITNYWPPTLSAWPGAIYNQITDYLECKELVSKIPTNATINGIRIGIKGRAADNSGKSGGYEYVEAKDSHVIFYLNSSAISDNKANTVDFWPVSSTTFYNYGSLTDNWNISSLTPATLNDPNFALRIAASFESVNLDKNSVIFGLQYVQIEISYEDSTSIAPDPITTGDTTSTTNNKIYAETKIYPSGQDTTNIGSEVNTNSALRQNIKPSGLPTVETITGDNIVRRNIRPSGIISGQSLSTAHRLRRNIRVPGIITGEDTINNNVVKPADWTITPNSITTEQTITNLNKLRIETYYIRPLPIETTEDTYNNNYVVLPGVYIFPFSVISAENVSTAHRLQTRAYILPPGHSEEETGDHRLRKDIKEITWQNQIYTPAYEVGYFDCLAISKDLNNDPFYNLSFSALNTNYFFSVSQYDLQFNQPTKLSQRLAGEGASPNTFAVSTLDNTLTLTMPVRVESWGYVDQCFAALYDFCIQGYKGTPTTFVGRLVSPTPNTAIGSTTFLKIDNIADFKSLGSNFTAYIRSDDNSETVETVTVTSVNKSEKRLYFLTPTTYNHTPNKSFVWTAPTRPTSDREPSFSLFSLREGLFSGCIVDKLSMTLVPGNNITATFTIKFTELDRQYQVNFRDNFNTIMSNITKRRPNYLLNSSLLRLYRTSPEVGYFNLGQAEDYKLFRGYQERHFRDFEINEMSLEISNNLQTVYTANSKNSSEIENLRKNLRPYAYYSNGRSIEGTIKYSSPIKPWLFEEVLSGPGSNNGGGIIYDFGPFKLTLPDVVWSNQNSSSSMDQVHQKTVSWSVATHGLVFNPYLVPTGAY